MDVVTRIFVFACVHLFSNNRQELKSYTKIWRNIQFDIAYQKIITMKYYNFLDFNNSFIKQCYAVARVSN